MLIITSESTPKLFWKVGSVSDRERRLLSRSTISAQCTRHDQIGKGELFAETSPAYQFFALRHATDTSAATKVTVDAVLREFFSCSELAASGVGGLSTQRDAYWFLRTTYRDRWARQMEWYLSRFPVEAREFLGSHLRTTEWRLSNELSARFSSERELLDDMSGALEAQRSLYHEIPLSQREG